MELKVKSLAGEAKGTVTLSDSVFGLEPRADILHRMVRWQLAKKQSGNHKAKTRGEVKATSKKMYRQKGTGNARAGSKQAPQRRGGGHAFALRNRDYSYRLPKKAVQAATRMAIASKLNSQDVIVLDELSLKAPKTQEVASILKAL